MPPKKRNARAQAKAEELRERQAEKLKKKDERERELNAALEDDNDNIEESAANANEDDAPTKKKGGKGKQKKLRGKAKAVRAAAEDDEDAKPKGPTKPTWPDYVHLKGLGLMMKGADNARDIHLDDISLQVPGKTLIKSASLSLAFGSRYGLVGRNGIGKSVLMKALAERDSNTVFGTIPKGITIMYVQQEVNGDDLTPLETVMNADKERTWLVAEEKRLIEEEERREREDKERDEKRLKALEEAKEAARQKAIAEGEDPVKAAKAVSHEIRMRYVQEDEEEDERRHAEMMMLEENIYCYTIQDIHDRLLEIDAYKAEPRAFAILSGLGFSDEDIRTKPTKEFSGGWRMRIALASALFIRPDLLILDEPTNHLDLEAVIWLGHYLSTFWKKTLLLVSHDAAFLSDTCNNIIHFHDQTLTQYKGDFYSYVRARTQREATQLNKFNAQKKKEMKEKASLQRQGKKLKNVKGRKAELMVLDTEELPPSIHFPDIDPEQYKTAVVQFNDVSFGYTPKKILFHDLDFGLYMNSRVGLVGPNGVGKSTLMKLMAGELEPVEGDVKRIRGLKVARFHQHHVDQLTMDMNPVEYLQSLYPEAQAQDLRQYLGKFGVKGKMALQSISLLSGGEKSRVVFAALCYVPPHILLVDEPTNHLDMDTIEVLIEAIKDYKGAVVLISHHQRLLEAACDELWVVTGEGTIEPVDGDFQTYKEMVMDNMELTEETEILKNG